MDWNKYKDTIQQADKNVQAVVSNGRIDTSTGHFTNTEPVRLEEVGQRRSSPKGGTQGWSVCERMFPDEEWTVPSELIEKTKRNERLELNYSESAY